MTSTPVTTNTYALGHFAQFIDDEGTVQLSLQNFFIGSTITYDGAQYLFSPFGFSGTSVNRQGDLEPAALAFPNNPIARGYLSDALRGMTYQGIPIDQRPYRRPWIGNVSVCIVNTSSQSVEQVLFTYTGQATAGGWDDTKLSLELSSVIDAAKGDVPVRALVKRQVGSLPTTTSIRLR